MTNNYMYQQLNNSAQGQTFFNEQQHFHQQLSGDASKEVNQMQGSSHGKHGSSHPTDPKFNINKKQ